MQFNPVTTYPIGTWWSTLENIETWVKQRGVNVLIWQNQIDGNVGDWEAMHEKVDELRQAGYPLWIIRQPGYLLQPDPQPVSFDEKWRDHLLAFSMPDEFEDKVPGASLWSNLQPIIDFTTTQVNAYRQWLPGVPIFANFNGTHISSETIGKYAQIVAQGIDICCQDLYPIADQQVDPTNGNLLFQFSDFFRGTALLKQATGKPCWTYIETCNQQLGVAGADGWSPPWKFVGSRAPTPDELWQFAWYVGQGKGDGIAWFPEASNGAVNDATPPELATVIPQIAQHMQTLLAPPPAPVQPVPPPAKTVTHTITVFSDGSLSVDGTSP